MSYVKSSGMNIDSPYKYNPQLAGYAKLFENAVKPVGKVDAARSLVGWQNRVISAHNALMEIQKQHDTIRDSINSTYRPEAAQKQLQPYDDELKAVREMAISNLTEDLEEVCESKRKTFQKSLDAPTDEQLRMLQVLALRDDITAAEAGSVAGKLGNNLHAQKALASILKKNGLHMPPLLTEEEFEVKIADAKEYAVKMLNSIGMELGKMTYDQAMFYRAPGSGFAAMKFGDLDNSGFTAAQIAAEIVPETEEKENPKDNTAQDKKPVTAQESGKNATQIYCQGYESLNVIAAQFGVSPDTIRQANPGVNLSNLECGTKIIVPSTRMKYSSVKGAVSADACSAVEYNPAPAEVYAEGQEIKID